MEKAYIVLAHKNPEQVKRLITALDDGYSTFFLHVDKKSYSPQWKQISYQSFSVSAIESMSTIWGGLGVVNATLNAMRAIAKHKKKFDFISVISGQHYPIKSNRHINEYLSDTPFRTFLEYSAIPDYERWKIRGGLYRIDKYYLGLRTHERYTAKALNFLATKIDALKRKFPENMRPYAGSQWFTVDNYSMEYIIDFVKSNPNYSTFHKYTFVPDELFFHNILLNTEDERVRSGITNNNLLYMNWPDRNSGHPEVLTLSDQQNIFNSGALLARKFDMDRDAEILDRIDENRRYEMFEAKQGA